MTRQKLAQTLRQTAIDMEYHFYSGFENRMGETIIAYPALWLSPAKIVAVEGRREGRVRYRVALQLMQLCRKSSREAREEAWEGLEEDAMRVYRTLAQTAGIVAVKVAECTPAEFTLTNHGEVSVALVMEVEIPFCNL